MANIVNFSIFVSYSWKNKTEVHKLCDLLAKKYKLWLDKNEMTHGNMNDKMRDGIDESEIFLCCATTDYCRKEGTPSKELNTLKEFNYATAKGKEIFYVIFENFKNKQDRLDQLKEISFEFANEMYYKHDQVNSILDALEKMNVQTF